jgi:hypothetical protein
MRFLCSKITEHLRPKTTENLRRKTEQVFTNNEYCHANGKSYCHTNQTASHKQQMLFKQQFWIMNKSDQPET